MLSTASERYIAMTEKVKLYPTDQLCPNCEHYSFIEIQPKEGELNLKYRCVKCNRIWDAGMSGGHFRLSRFLISDETHKRGDAS